MTSAWANPILYGFLNENFKKEFNSMYKKFQETFNFKSSSTGNDIECIPI